jgi:hypothetical protein
MYNFGDYFYMLPILFFYDNHFDGATPEVLIKVLSSLAQIGYKHICFETDVDLANEMANVTDVCNSYTKTADASFWQNFNRPHASGVGDFIMTLPREKEHDLLNIFGLYSDSKRLDLLQTINRSEFFFHPIDTLSFPINSPERNNFMTTKILEVVRAFPASGIIVFCGLGHYKIEQSIKKQNPKLPIISFHILQTDWLFTKIITKQKKDVFIQKIYEVFDQMHGGEHRIFADTNSDTKICGIKLDAFNPQQTYDTVKQKLSPHELLLAIIEKYPLNQQDKQTLQNREYGKFLRTVCNAGRADLLEILLLYRSLLPAIDPDQRNSQNLSARDYAQKYPACLQLLNGK